MKAVIEQFHAKVPNIVGELETAFPDQFTVYLTADDGSNKKQVGYCWKSSGNFRATAELRDNAMKCCQDAVNKFCDKQGNTQNVKLLDKKVETFDDAE